MRYRAISNPAEEIDPTHGPLDAAMRWFAARGWTPFQFQKDAWQAYLDGGSGLVYAPTGIGKTLAAWMGPLLEALGERRKGGGMAPVKHRDQAPPLRVLWITPLRALAADIRDALALPVSDLGLGWTIETRTGDTPGNLRRRQQKRLPTALVTTPESLSLQLSYPDAVGRFGQLRAVVVDEWHELMGSKRGVLTELALARLRGWYPALRVWGLSATLGNTETAMKTLLGRRARAGRLIHDRTEKIVHIESIIPADMDRFPWAGHIGLNLLPAVVERIQRAGSTLVFTNTRSQTEIWFRAILERRPDWAGATALHHGSLDRDNRAAVESLLGRGRLKCVVCTSSLDLGVDFSPVDQVIQIGSPKGIARLMQRAGRSGHRPGEASRVLCVPTNAFELIEIAAARRALQQGHIEPRRPVVLPLDVLAQHLVSTALGGGFDPEALYAEVKTTHAFAELSRSDYRWVLDFVSTGGPSLQAYREYSKLRKKNGRYAVADDAIARRHRMNIGTITGDAVVAVKFLNGRRLGSIEERFVSRLKRGDSFVFAGRLLEYVRLRDMVLLVRKSKSTRGPVPQWMGGRMPLSTELAAAVRDRIEALRNRCYADPELVAVQPLAELQSRWSALPENGQLLLEKINTREGRHLFIYPFEGHRVNEGLGALLAFRIARLAPITISVAVNDYGLELLSDRPIPVERALRNGIFDTGRLMEDILESLNAAEMARRQFREIARVAGLVFQGYPGRPKSGAQLQGSSSLLYNVFRRYDPDNLLLAQSAREVLEQQLAYRRLKESLQRLSSSRWVVTEPPHPTPLAFPIMVNRLRTRVSSEKLAERVRRMQLQLEKAADKKGCAC